MSLVDFMQKLQEQDDSDVVYSAPPEPTIKVIPPEKPASVKIIPPESTVETNKQPVKIKLKINKQFINIDNNINSNNKVNSDNTQNNNNQTNQTVQATQTVQKIQSTQEPIQQNVQSSVQPQVTNQKIEQPVLSEEEKITQLFIKSGTEDSKKTMWIDCYKRAQSSRKHNSVADKLRLGEFTITPDNKVFILPDYPVVGKDPDDILKSYDWLSDNR